MWLEWSEQRQEVGHKVREAMGPDRVGIQEVDVRDGPRFGGA